MLLRRIIQHAASNLNSSGSLRHASSLEKFAFETLAVSEPRPHVFHVEFNRPEQLNAFNTKFWKEFLDCFNGIRDEPNCRAVVVSGAGRLFSAGIDLKDMASTMTVTINPEDDIARRNATLLKIIRTFQQSLSAPEQCTKPVIAAIHGACIGGAVDLITGVDIRYCTSDAWFQVKEVEIGMAADVGTLQRLPRVVASQSLVRELAFTARKLYSDEALQCGLVSRVFPNKACMLEAAIDLAADIASKSPLAVQGTKIHLNYSRDHTVEEGLEHMAVWNMSMLQSEDLMKAAMSSMSKDKEPPLFSNL